MDRFSGPSGMLAIRDARDKRADNHEDGACLFRVVICVACAMRPFSNAKNFEADLFVVVRVWLRETSECTTCLFSVEAVARAAYFARRFFSTIKRLDDISK